MALTDEGWQLVNENTPRGVWLRTKREGEDGENVCALVTYDEEWVEKSTGRTTVTHHSFAAPTHWRPL